MNQLNVLLELLKYKQNNTLSPALFTILAVLAITFVNTGKASRLVYILRMKPIKNNDN